MELGKHLPLLLLRLPLKLAIFDKLNKLLAWEGHQRDWYLPANTVLHLILQIENHIMNKVVELSIFSQRHDLAKSTQVRTKRPDLGNGFDRIVVDAHARSHQSIFG